ncbi:hypothetical protein COO60DRAFT_1502264 [Scenedesmus sp. NREL 46B-D3]|nr:hypothetical protein COO60DRAFT_1502264 [Scenedesmus sp. NREL 46B-D3]
MYHCWYCLSLLVLLLCTTASTAHHYQICLSLLVLPTNIGSFVFQPAVPRKTNAGGPNVLPLSTTSAAKCSKVLHRF